MHHKGLVGEGEECVADRIYSGLVTHLISILARNTRRLWPAFDS